MYYNNKGYVFRFIFGDYIHQYLKELYHTTLLEQWKLHPEKVRMKRIFILVQNYHHERKTDHHDSREFWQTRIFEDLQRFPCHIIMLHTENNMKVPTDILQYLLKVFSMFNTSIWYDASIVNEQVPYSVGIMYTNLGKVIGC